MQKGIAAALCIAVVVTLPIVIFLSLKPRVTTRQEAELQTRRLIDEAGGFAKICDEAKSLLSQFGTAKLKTFRADELKDYPAIKALGKVDGIWPSSPPFLKVRVGTQRKGFEIHVFDKELNSEDAAAAGVYRIDHCIYVVR